MGIKATNILSSFFTRRDEDAGEVLSTAKAVALINEAQQELTGLKLLVKEASITWDADETEVDMPDDFMALASDRAYLDDVMYQWQPFKGKPDQEGLVLVPGNKARLSSAPTSEKTLKFIYTCAPTVIPDAPNDEEVMNGILVPNMERFFLHRMLEAAYILDGEPQLAQAMEHRADSAKGEMILWRHNTYSPDTTDWIPDPYTIVHDDYVAGY